MNISQDFSLTASVWDGDKFLIEAATANGSRQMKVTAEVVRAYPQRGRGPILGHGPTGAPLPWLHGFRRDLAILSRHGPPAGGVVRPICRTLRRG